MSWKSFIIQVIHCWGGTFFAVPLARQSKGRSAHGRVQPFLFPESQCTNCMLKCAQSHEDEEALSTVDCKIHMHIGSPAGQLLNLSVHQRKEQLWPCIGKTSGELLGSTECKAPLKTHPLLQTTTKTSPLPKVSSGSGNHASFHSWGNRAGDTALLCKYGMWHWSEELWEKRTEEQVSWGTGSSGGSDAVVTALSEWPWQTSADQTSSHRSNPQ